MDFSQHESCPRSGFLRLKQSVRTLGVGNVDFHEKYFLAQFEEVCIFQNKIYNF